jgi:hypothetical protein
LNFGFEGIYAIKDIDGIDNNKSSFHGFSIIQEVEFRYILDHKEDSGEPEPYRCRIASPHCLECTMPGPSYTFTNDQSNCEGSIESCVLDGVDHDAHKLLAADASVATGANERK